GDVGFARDTIASLGAANKHVRDDARKIGRFVYCYKIMALHFAFEKKSNDINDLRESERGNQRKVDKLGPSLSGRSGSTSLWLIGWAVGRGG
ncbi:hypothetical protein, partial [Verminephrobacter aporrectodeae]|uniref:hypothetical protein n=1 Tax=Verminephrobacter aporrectodeae TaxID=1110389 RepID=UPI0022443F99